MTPPWIEVTRGPLVPVAVAAGLGLLADRYGDTPLSFGVATAVAGLIGWATATARRPVLALPFLWLAFAGIAAAYHHTHRHSFPPDDIGEFASVDPRIARIRGIVLDEPVTRRAAKADPLTPRGTDRDTTTLRITGISASGGAWLPASGKSTLTVDRDADTGPPLG
ncbi:MAG: hypothetical protein ACRC7O_11200, partial [Fimbriiglobus sp.]